MWICNKPDGFDFPKLKVRFNDPLPGSWQYMSQVNYLRRRFGEECVRHVSGDRTKTGAITHGEIADESRAKAVAPPAKKGLNKAAS